MHALHKILVLVNNDEDELKDYANQTQFTKDEILRETKDAGVKAIEDYGEGDVWDWHADGPGRWEDEVPYDGVILGAADPAAFLKEFEEARLKPLELAKESLQTAISQYTDDGQAHEINEDLLSKSFFEDGYTKLHMYTYCIGKAMRLINGDYHFDSFFYNGIEYNTRLSTDLLEQVRQYPHRFALVCIDLHN